MFKQLQLVFTLTIASLVIFPSSVQPLPDPPPSPPPPGNPKPRGTFSGNTSQCKKTMKELNALIPNNDRGALLRGQGLTTSQYPTFWVYVPYAPEDIQSGEFSLHDRTERTIYRGSIKLPKTPGIVSITLPSETKYTLEQGKFYHWYFSINCQGNTSIKPDKVVDGWVQKVTMTSNPAAPDIWYDSLNRLANLRLTNDSDTLRNEWNNLLKSVGLEDIAQEQLAGAIELTTK